MNKQNLYGKRKYSEVNPSSISIHYLQMDKNENFNKNSLLLKPFKATTEKKHVVNEIETENELESIKEEECCWLEKTNLFKELEKENIYEFHTNEETKSVENLNMNNLNQTINMFNTIKQHPIKL